MNIGINDKLDALISLTAKECGNDDVEMFNNLDTSKVSLDKRFYLKLRQIISKHKHTAVVLTLKKFFVRAAVALMALMSLGFLTIMATPDLRESVFEAVVEWYENYFSIQFKPAEDDTVESSDASLTENSKEESELPSAVTHPTKIEKVMKPTYIPDGLEEELAVKNNSGVTIDYFWGDTLCFTYHQKLLNKHNILFDNDTATITEIRINNNPAQLIEFSDRETIIIVWTDGMYTYYIELQDPAISTDELIKIASSVK